MRAHEKLRILLVDDHAAVRHGLALVLTEEGIGECQETSGRDEALAAADCQPPDIALVDLSLGGDDALQLVAELSARNVPVLVCSMHKGASYVRRALAAGARGYITKPGGAPGTGPRSARCPGRLDPDQSPRRGGDHIRGQAALTLAHEFGASVFRPAKLVSGWMVGHTESIARWYLDE